MFFLKNLTIYLILFNLILCSYFKHTTIGWAFVANGFLAQSSKWKWMAAILIENSGNFYHNCGGSLVSAQHIVTAAHCLIRNDTLLSTKSIIIRLGQYDLRRVAHDFKVHSYVVHPMFNKKNLNNDIAVIKLAKNVNFNVNIKPISISKVNGNYSFERENGSEIAFIAGWGRTANNGEFSDDLMDAKLHIYPKNECQNAYKNHSKINEQHICAKAPDYSLEQSDACRGDSGGPLVQFDENSQTYILTGVISYGKKCGHPDYPGVYTRVQYFSKWIQRYIINKGLSRSYISPVGNIQQFFNHGHRISLDRAYLLTLMTMIKIIYSFY